MTQSQIEDVKALIQHVEQYSNNYDVLHIEKSSDGSIHVFDCAGTHSKLDVLYEPKIGYMDGKENCRRI